jgi:hypothetical protein
MLVLRAIVAVFRAFFATKANLAIENLALRQQLIVLKEEGHILHFGTATACSGSAWLDPGIDGTGA